MVILKESIATEEDIFLFSSIKKELEEQQIKWAQEAIDEANRAEQEYLDQINNGEYDDLLTNNW